MIIKDKHKWHRNLFVSFTKFMYMIRVKNTKLSTCFNSKCYFEQIVYNDFYEITPENQALVMIIVIILTYFTRIMLIPYRDNSRFSAEISTNENSFADENYECIGNESSILDCSKNDKQCTSFRDFFERTELNCKGKGQRVLSLSNCLLIQVLIVWNFLKCIGRYHNVLFLSL